MTEHAVDDAGIGDKGKKSEQWQNKSKIPHQTTWLNQHRWEGDPPPEPMQQKQRDHITDTVGAYDPSRERQYACKTCGDTGKVVVLPDGAAIPFDGDESFWGKENMRRCTCEAGKQFSNLEIWRPE